MRDEPKECLCGTRGPLSTAFNVLVRNILISFLQRPAKAVDVLKEHQGLFLT